MEFHALSPQVFIRTHPRTVTKNDMAFHTYYVLVCVDQECNFVQDCGGRSSPIGLRAPRTDLAWPRTGITVTSVRTPNVLSRYSSVLFTGFPLVALSAGVTVKRGEHDGRFM